MLLISHIDKYVRYLNVPLLFDTSDVSELNMSSFDLAGVFSSMVLCGFLDMF